MALRLPLQLAVSSTVGVVPVVVMSIYYALTLSIAMLKVERSWISWIRLEVDESLGTLHSLTLLSQIEAVKKEIVNEDSYNAFSVNRTTIIFAHCPYVSP
jgi:hypothetical protein